MRTGLLTRKLGMTRIFAADGAHVPVTVLKLEKLEVMAQRTTQKDGYNAIVVGATPAKAKNVAKAQREQFAKVKQQVKSKIMEFRVDADKLVDIGAELSAAHFVAGQFVDVSARTKGRGFTGVMKRWNFGGLRATHGVSVSHRSPGSTGNRQDPGRTFKGKKMAGHYGDEKVTTQNLQIVAVDEAEGLIMVRGSVPGAKGGYVIVRDAVKRALPKDAPQPAAVKTAASA